MERPMLESRFRLVAHLTTRALPAYRVGREIGSEASTSRPALCEAEPGTRSAAGGGGS